MSKKIYGIGQELETTKDIEMKKLLSEKTVAIKKGTKVFVGADGYLHYLDGGIQKLPSDIGAEGYSVTGIAEWIYMWISSRLPLDEFLDDYDIEVKEFKGQIEDALEELGMWDSTGNRS